MKTVVRWFAKPRLNYIDCITAGLVFALAPSISWWALLIALVGIFFSTAVEMAVRP